MSRLHRASCRSMCVAKLSIISWLDQLQSNAEKKVVKIYGLWKCGSKRHATEVTGEWSENVSSISCSAEDSIENSCCSPESHIDSQSVLKMYISSDKMSTERIFSFKRIPLGSLQNSVFPPGWCCAYLPVPVLLSLIVVGTKLGFSLYLLHFNLFPLLLLLQFWRSVWIWPSYWLLTNTASIVLWRDLLAFGNTNFQIFHLNWAYSLPGQ